MARAAGDPNTLMLVFDSHVTNPLVYPQLPYTLRDFTPISRLLSFPLVFAVPAEPAGRQHRGVHRAGEGRSRAH